MREASSGLTHLITQSKEYESGLILQVTVNKDEIYQAVDVYRRKGKLPKRSSTQQNKIYAARVYVYPSKEIYPYTVINEVIISYASVQGQVTEQEGNTYELFFEIDGNTRLVTILNSALLPYSDIITRFNSKTLEVASTITANAQTKTEKKYSGKWRLRTTLFSYKGFEILQPRIQTLNIGFDIQKVVNALKDYFYKNYSAVIKVPVIAAIEDTLEEFEFTLGRIENDVIKITSDLVDRALHELGREGEI